MNKKITVTRIALICVAVIAVAGSIIMISQRIGNLENENLLLKNEINNLNVIYGRPSDESTVCFTNIGTWGSELVELYYEEDSYTFEDDSGKYVILKEGSSFMRFDDYGKLSVYQWNYNGFADKETVVPYAVVNRELLLLEGGGFCRILEGETVNETQIIKISATDVGSATYIPYEALDMNSMALYKSAPDCNYYKVYVK